ncbi:MAG: lysostaphin resistance A-like protein [Candidatus Saccharibacteria bacterium]
MERSGLMSQEYARRQEHEVAGWQVTVILVLPMVVGCFSVYTYKLTADEQALLLSVAFLAMGLLSSTALAVSHRRSISLAASGVAVVNALSLFIILVPRSGFVYADVLILFVATVGVLLLHRRFAELPSIGASRLRESSVAAVLFLPMGLAVAQSLFLGLRFWESYPIGKTSLLFIPLLAVWGFAEEGLFRGVLQRSAYPLLGGGGSIILTAVLSSAFALFWGSLPYAIFSFLFGLLMGYMYLRSRSLMYVGTIHALMDTWMVISYLFLGIVIP